ncbi:glycosyltransferase family protein [Halomonas sp. 328]|uniref:hypothetical protein n=1 Tax=Halomonas sp. 328 TaxID=2776704 RepID=UPI0018A74F4F|nr:hypothetical protein [Halomonas sp. 328]MBF8224470.1 hypothetical protein [Halomonas sp. 328]
MKKISEVFLLNDKKDLNARYRSALESAIRASGAVVKSKGVYESILSPFKIFFEILYSRPLVVSSNIKSNLFFLSLPWIRGLVILNGVGRYREIRVFRQLLIFLFFINARKVVAIQSYSDYRYFRRYSSSRQRLRWVPGSGGSQKEFGTRQGVVLVQRDNKLPLVFPSVSDFLKKTHFNGALFVVGCNNITDLESLFDSVQCEVVNIGFVPQDDIFHHGDAFLQPSGYGEGFPHTLADAIASRMKIYISKLEYLRYGLREMEFQVDPVADGWLQLVPSEAAAKMVSEESVTNSYLEALDSSSGLIKGYP